MKEIGKRAAAEIRQQAYDNDTDISFELVCINTCRQDMYSWEKGKTMPSALKLRNMALAGYDVHYILTGGRK